MPRASPFPVAVSVFPDELYPSPRSWAEQAFPKLIHFNTLEKGGHFAAWEQPELFIRGSARGPQIAAHAVTRAVTNAVTRRGRVDGSRPSSDTLRGASCQATPRVSS